MGFYHNNIYQTTLKLVNDNLSIIDNQCYLLNGDSINIVNNEKMIFDFSDFIQTIDNDASINENPNFKISDCLYKIYIDFKDGETVTLQKPIRGNDKSWLLVEHLFTFKKILRDETIDIILYNLYGFETKLKLKFNAKSVSIKNSGIELKLLNSNLSNDKNISYIFNNVTENQLILARNVLK